MKTVKVLIISYHYLPMDVIASYRAKGLVENFHHYGIRPTLLTHFWDDKPHTEPAFENKGTYDKIRIPIKKTLVGKWVDFSSKYRFLSKAGTFLLNLLGYFELHTLDSYFSMKSFLKEHLKKNNYVFLLSIYSPHYQVRIPYWVHGKYGIPYATDFRDLWDNTVIHKEYSPSLKEKLRDKLIKYYWGKWLSKAAFFSITSKPWLEVIRQLTKTEGVVITNGFDYFLNPEPTNSDFLTVTHIGSLYNHQKLEIFLSGFKEAISKNNVKAKLVFVGSIREGSSSRTGYMKSPENFILNYLASSVVEFIERTTKENALNYLAKSDMLLFPSFPDNPGTYSGKFFDYLASGKNMIMVPNDHGVCEDVIKKCNCGYIADTPEEVNLYITKKYHEKLQYGNIAYKGRKELIQKYSRKYQAGILAKKITSYSFGS